MLWTLLCNQLHSDCNTYLNLVKSCLRIFYQEQNKGEIFEQLWFIANSWYDVLHRLSFVVFPCHSLMGFFLNWKCILLCNGGNWYRKQDRRGFYAFSLFAMELFSSTIYKTQSQYSPCVKFPPRSPRDFRPLSL